MDLTRINKLAAWLNEDGVDAYFACRPVTMGYLAGFWEDPHERFLVLAIKASGEIRLIAPSLSASQATRIGIQDIRPWKDGEDPLTHLAQLAEDWRLKTAVIAVDDEMPAHMVLDIQATLPAALL